ncbi:TetR/AcrR family transcriptional regulator [Salibacterium aidingense]|uniref:TetR/AcrR family transcriptional regulator n=1 Tax=Salibacterium aidingense TaxID=384933 RepID=UPI00040C8475|nr:TetR/AcrR family transcriptional regulator [Salibacterium aidingense]
MDKHESIIVTALKMFSEKGYFSTSVQEIVSSCRISKGSFYNYFASKEDLLIEVFRYNHQQILKRAKNVHFDQSLSLKGQLTKIISLELEGIADNREFFLLLQKVVPVQENKKLLPLMKKTKAAMIRLHKDWLLEVYGDKIRPHIWDHVLFLQGAMKEYITLIKENNTTAEPDVFAQGIISKIDILVEHGSQLNPILTDDLMREYEQIAEHPGNKTKEEEREEQLTAAKARIEYLFSETEDKKQDYLDAVELLAEEWKKQEPRFFLIHALLAFLREHPELKPHADHMEKVL